MVLDGVCQWYRLAIFSISKLQTTEKVKSYKPQYTIVLLLLGIPLLCYLLIYIGASFIFEGKAGHSSSISESKSNGVFVSEYSAVNGPFRFDSSNCFAPGRIWIEKVWSKGNIFHPVITNKELNEYSNYWLYIEIPDNQLATMDSLFGMYGNKMAIRTSEGSFFWQRKSGNIHFLCASYLRVPEYEESLTILKNTDTLDRLLIPQKWKNAKIVNHIALQKLESSF